MKIVGLIVLALCWAAHGMEVDFAGLSCASESHDGRVGYRVISGGHGYELDCPKELNPEQGWISFWYRPQFESPNDGKLRIRYLIFTRTSSGDGVSIGLNTYGNSHPYPFFLTFNQKANAVNHGPYKPYAMTANQWHRFELGWDAKSQWLAVDGNLIESKPRRGDVPWGDKIYLGSGSDKGYQADGLLADMILSGKARTFEGKRPLVIQATDGESIEGDLFLDDQRGFFFRYSSPKGSANATIRPASFELKRGDLIWVEQTGGRSYEIEVAEDGKLELTLPKALHDQVMLSKASQNLLGELSFSVRKLAGDVPIAPYYVRTGMSMNCLWEEEGEPLGDFRGDVVLANDGKSGIVARSNPVKLTKAGRYLFSVDTIASGLCVGNGYGIGLLLEREGASPVLRQCRVNRVNLPDGLEQSFLVSISEEFVGGNVRVLIWSSGLPFRLSCSRFDLRLEPYRVVKGSRRASESELEATISESELESLLSKLSAKEFGVERVGRRTMFTMDGQAEPYLFFYSFPNWRGCKEFMADGVRLQYLFCKSASGPNAFWKGAGKYDFTAFDVFIKRVLRQAPGATLCLALGCDPWYGFSKEFPDSITRNEEGQQVTYGWRAKPESEDDPYMVFYGSPDYLREAKGMIHALCEHLQQVPWGKAIVGVHIKGGWDEQWFPPHFTDRAPQSLDAFRKFLSETYANDVEAFRRAWGMPEVTFETAGFPDWNKGTARYFLEPSRPVDKRTIDLLRYRSAVAVNTILELAKTFKTAMNRPFWTSAYYNDGRGGNDLGKDRLAEILNSPWLDAVSSCIPYGGFRLAGENGISYSHTASIDLHGKKQLAELDYRTDYSNYGIRGQGYDLTGVGATKGHQEHLNILKRDLGYAFSQNQSGWFFALSGQSWADPVLRQHVRLAKRTAATILAKPDVNDYPPVAVFLDDDVSCYSRIGNFSRNLEQVSSVELSNVLTQAGTGFSSYLLEDIVHPELPTAKVYVFARSPHLSEAQIRHIETRYQRDGNMLVFCFDAGRLSPYGCTESIRRLTGISVVLDENAEVLYRHLPGGVDTALGRTLDYLNADFTAPLLYVTDRDAEVLARLKSRPELIVGAIKRHPGWTGVYLAAPMALTPQFIHALVTEAGGTPLLEEPGDAFYAGNGVVAIHALRDGVKRIRVPSGRRLVDLDTEKQVGQVGQAYSFELKVGESRWFKNELAK